MEKLIAWTEIPTEDLNRGVAFYSKLLEIKLQITASEKESMACFPTGEGALIKAPGFIPANQGIVVSFNVGNRLDKVLEEVVHWGGKIVHPKTKIEAEERGYFALIIDSEGNRIGLYGK
ncbi:MAG: VOC family protein [Bacteroidales bacterium]